MDSENVVSETDQEDHKPPLKHQKGSNEKHNRSHVAALLGMKSVSPRAIAYIAVQVGQCLQRRDKGLGWLDCQLRFVLSSCNCWCIIDEDFDYQKFYSNIILFFEGVRTTQEKKEISDLLFWWNQCVFLFYLWAANACWCLASSVFGHVNASTYRPQAIENRSVASTLRKQCERLAITTWFSSTVWGLRACLWEFALCTTVIMSLVYYFINGQCICSTPMNALDHRTVAVLKSSY